MSRASLRLVEDAARLRPGEAYAASMHPSRRDGWQNLVTGLGTSRDKATYHEFAPGLYLTDYQLDALYSEDDFAHRGVGAIVKEAFKLGYNVVVRPSTAKSEDDPGEAQELAGDIIEDLDEWDLDTKFVDCAGWGRLFGGGILYFDCDDGRYPHEPLDESSIRAIDGIHAYDRRSFTVRSRYRAPHQKAGQAETYWHHPIAEEEGRVGVIHESRLVVFGGAATTRFRFWQNGGWDDSVLVRVYATLVSCSANWQSICHLMHDFSQGVFGLKDLVELIRSGQEAVVQKRLEFLDKNRASNRAIAVDKEHESFERRSSEMSGADKLADKTWLRLAAAFEMPVTVLMGQSPTGFDATGTSDQTVWYDTVGQYQRQRLRRPIKRAISILLLAQDGPTGGRVPRRLSIAFPPLWTGTPKDRAAEQEAIAKRDALYVQAQILSPHEVALSRFTDHGWSPETTIDRHARHELRELDMKRRLEVARNPPAPPVAPTGAAERPQSPDAGTSEPSDGSTPGRVTP
ncbi:MAG: DUF1073 domain-containing protein [Deltaproteobacteria bacterium]|nr:DUF1073 domain-containing protein [Deltaproteobacteria bacterium]